MERFAAEVAENRSYLTKLDAAIGDGDHGTNMDRGMRKVIERLQTTDGDDIGASLKAVGMALVSSVGGAAGPLYGTFFMQMGQATAGRPSSTSPPSPTRSTPGCRACAAREGRARRQDHGRRATPALEALRGGGRRRRRRRARAGGAGRP